MESAALPQTVPVEPRPEPPRAGAGPGDVALGVLSAIGLGLAVMVPLMVVGVVDFKKADFGLLWFPVDAVITIFVAWYFGCRRHGRSLREGWSYLPAPRRLLALAALLGVAYGALVFLLPRTSDQSPMYRMVTALVQRPGGGLFILGGSMLAAVVEEIYYRGFIFTALASRWGRTASAVIVALWFTILHVYQLGGQWLLVAVIGLLSVTVTLLRAFTGSMLPGLVTHLVYNVCLTLPVAVTSVLGKS